MTDADKRAIGERIGLARELLGMTQAALGAKVYVTQPAVSQWESGKTLPTRAMQHALADALGTRRSILFRELVRHEERSAA